MLKKKAFNRIFFTTIIFFIVFSIYSLKEINNNDKNYKKESDIKAETIYTLNKDNYISKTSIYVSKMLSLEDKIKSKLETMTKDNNKNSLLPSYFKPILPANTKVLEVKKEDSLVKIYFSKELLNINKEQSEKMIESIVYTITDDSILGIEIYAGGNMLKYVPHTMKELPTILTKDIGINKSYEIDRNSDIKKVFMTYYTNNDNSYHEVPVTKYVNDNREKLEIIFDKLNEDFCGVSLISLLENVKLINYKIESNKIVININKEITEDEKKLIFESIFANYNVKKIELLVNGEKKFTKTTWNINIFIV